MIIFGQQETKDLAAICRVYLALDPMQPVEDSKRRRALAQRVINESEQGGKR